MNSQYHSCNDKTNNAQTDPAVETLSACGSDSSLPHQDSSRRRFLQMTLGGTAAGLAAAAGMEFVTPPRVLAQSVLSPDAALQELMDGNKRFTSRSRNPSPPCCRVPTPGYPLNWFSTRPSDTSSLRASPGISPLRRLSPALNMV